MIVLLHLVLFVPGYSYIAPSILFSENLISDEIFCMDDLKDAMDPTDKKPSNTNLIRCKLKVINTLYDGVHQTFATVILCVNMIIKICNLTNYCTINIINR